MRRNSKLALSAVSALTALAIGVGVFAAASQGAVKIIMGSYATDALLSKPTIVGPVNGEQLAYPDDPVKLQWQTVPGTTSYEAQIAREADSSIDCQSEEAWQANNIILTHTSSELGWAPEMTSEETGSALWTGSFCWRVRATGSGTGIWSTSSRFDMSWSAQATDLRFYSDEDGSIPRSSAGSASTTGFDTGYVEWSGVRGAASYEIQFSEAPTFGANSIFATKIYPGTRMLLPQMPDNNYSWRVRPIAANGTHGAWSDAAVFTIQRDTRYWTTNGAAMYPAQGATVDDIKVGWEPVPGASYYRYMAAVSSTVFPELETLVPYGTAGAGCGSYISGRLSSAAEASSSTINNWVTMAGLIDPAVVSNLGAYCLLSDGGTPLDPTDDTYSSPPLPGAIHWRVYPVWQLSSATETGWNVTTRSIVGSPVQRSFTLAPYDNTAPVSPTIGMVNAGQCSGDPCLRLMGGSMSPLNSDTNSTTMQVPVFDWGAYQGLYANGPGSFRIDIARDNAFNNAVHPAGTSALRGWIGAKGPAKRDDWAPSSNGMTLFGNMNRSFALTTGLPDEGLDGNGYFWRALPCESGISQTDNAHSGYACINKYNDATGPGQSTGIIAGTPNSGALEFAKRVRVTTAVITGFTETTPMLMVGPNGAGSTTSDYATWQRGIQGADHYEFEVSRSQGFGEGTRVFKTTVPRIVPWGATPADLLDAGAWFWRVRAVDRDGLTGTWSNASSFTVASIAPTVTSKSASAGIGATVQWSPVTGASLYQMQWATSTGFTSAMSVDTRQTAYHIPSTVPGQHYWRVRTKLTATTYGAWSVVTPVTIYAPSTIGFRLSRSVSKYGAFVTIDGDLKVAGSASNGQRVLLQRKSTACNVSGRYRYVTRGITGKGADDGMARIRVRMTQNGCFRLAWVYGNTVVTSASFVIGVQPTVAFKLRSKSVRRGKYFCSSIASNRPITGRLRVQYRVGFTWITARSASVRSMRKRTQCMAISRAGTFKTRLVVDNMVARGGWKVYDDVIVYGTTIRVNDKFVIRR